MKSRRKYSAEFKREAGDLYLSSGKMVVVIAADRGIERFHKTLQNEFYAIAFRKELYSSIEELQTDLEDWMHEYNHERTHSGKHYFGKTPMQTFVDSIELAREKMLDKKHQRTA